MNLLSKECLAEVKVRAYEGARARQVGEWLRAAGYQGVMSVT